MLVLGRRQGESVWIRIGGQELRVIVKRGCNVRLGFEGPADFTIDRERAQIAAAGDALPCAGRSTDRLRVAVKLGPSP